MTLSAHLGQHVDFQVLRLSKQARILTTLLKVTMKSNVQLFYFFN